MRRNQNDGKHDNHVDDDDDRHSSSSSSSSSLLSMRSLSIVLGGQNYPEDTDGLKSSNMTTFGDPTR